MAWDGFVSVRPGCYFAICDSRNEDNFGGIVSMISRADVVGAGEEYSSADGEGGAIVELFELLVGIIPIGA